MSVCIGGGGTRFGFAAAFLKALQSQYTMLVHAWPNASIRLRKKVCGKTAPGAAEHPTMQTEYEIP